MKFAVPLGVAEEADDEAEVEEEVVTDADSVVLAKLELELDETEELGLAELVCGAWLDARAELSEVEDPALEGELETMKYPPMPATAIMTTTTATAAEVEIAPRPCMRSGRTGNGIINIGALGSDILAPDTFLRRRTVHQSPFGEGETLLRVFR